MGLVSIDAKILEALKSSTCFGVAYDENTPECNKLCDVVFQCKAKCSGEKVSPPTKKAVATPSTNGEPVSFDKTIKTQVPKKANHKESKKVEAVKKKTEAANSNAPDFKNHTLEDLKKIAEENKVEWKDYGNDNITRMRLIMAVKKLY